MDSTPPLQSSGSKPTRGRQMHQTGVIFLFAGLQFLAGCATAPFVSSPVEQATFTDRAIVQTQETVRVAAAVPDSDETRSLTGLDLYAKGIQPVWLQVTNLGDARVRAAIHSVDDEYFSPMEVAWKFRSDFGKTGRADMERWFFDNQLPRWIDPGDTRSGFVFTHVARGSKGFNFDVYASGRSFNFTFLIRIAGFFAGNGHGFGVLIFSLILIYLYLNIHMQQYSTNSIVRQIKHLFSRAFTNSINGDGIEEK